MKVASASEIGFARKLPTCLSDCSNCSTWFRSSGHRHKLYPGMQIALRQIRSAQLLQITESRWGFSDTSASNDDQIHFHTSVRNPWGEPITQIHISQKS